MPWVCTIERAKSHARARLNHWICLAVQIERAIITITRSELLAGNCEGTILTVPCEDGATGGTDKYLRVGYMIYLNLIAIIEEENFTVLAIDNIKRLALNGSRLLREPGSFLVTKCKLRLHLVLPVKPSVCKDSAICRNELGTGRIRKYLSSSF